MEKVCLTGASGFIASWIVKLLLERGYTVNATVRSLNDPTKTENLVSLDGAKERLYLLEANLMEEGSYDSAIRDCQGVFHVATPVIMDYPNPQEDIVDQALKGTLNVLTSCAKHSIRRVILSSSFATIENNGRILTPETVIDETWFSTIEGAMKMKGVKWYAISKILAEDAAWKFAKEKGMDIVSMNPVVVIGPFFQPPSLNYGAAVILDLINGIKWDDYPKPFTFSKERAESLGINYIPLRVALKETIQSLKEKKFINYSSIRSGCFFLIFGYLDIVESIIRIELLWYRGGILYFYRIRMQDLYLSC